MVASRLSLSIRADIGKRFVPFLRKQVRAANRMLAKPLADVSIALVNDGMMSALHMHYMKIAGPTDVLTFPLDEVGGGEIVICVPEARRRAKECGTRVANELLLYAIHGMLHLGGMDDRTQRGYEQMHRMEDRILTQLGVGPVFTPRAGRR